jgi:phenylacetate-CoA ligase
LFLNTLVHCYELSKNQWLKPAELRRLQEKRLAALLKHSYENVPLCKRKFDSVGLKSADVRGLEDLARVPLTTKQEIRAGIPSESISQAHDLSEYLWVSTSGTSGGPMPVFYDTRFMEYSVASWHFRKYRAIGVQPWDRVMRVDYNMPEPSIPAEKAKMAGESKPRSIGRTALGNTSYRLLKRRRLKVYIRHGGEDVLPDLVRFKPKLLHANPSYLRLIAESMADRGITARPEVVRTGGEVTDSSARRYLESAFGCDVFDEYSTWDFGHGAWQCKKREGYHIDADFLILEVLHEGEPVAPGERGEIVVTGLMNYAMPLIRYRVGDVGTMSDELCSCGRVFPLLKSVEGRIVDCFKLPNGMTVPPRAIMTVVQGTPGVSRYQVVQESLNRVTVALMRKETDPKVSKEELTSRLREVIGEDMEIEVFLGSRENLKAKFRPVVSKLTVEGEIRWAEPHGRLTPEEQETL